MNPPSGFQPASSLLQSTGRSTPAGPSSSSGSTAGSMRNASGGLPPLPPPGPAPEASTSSSAGGAAATGSSSTSSTAAAPAKPINRPAASKNSIVYSSVQRRNPVLAAIRNVGIEVGDIAADYQVGAHNGVLFLSLKYHRLHPEYIHQRIENMRSSYNVRIILVLCDVNEHHQSLRELTKIALINNFTIFVAWSNEEVAQYLVTLKQSEHRSADTLKERVQQTYHDQLQHVLTSGKKVNKTDADSLAAEFGSFDNISRKSAKQLSAVKGLGATKVTSLIDAFNKPFLVGGLRRPAGGAAADAGGGGPAGVSAEEEEALDAVGGGAGVAGVNGAVWRDPLDDDDEDEEEAADGDGEPSAKRVRTGA
ncbi:hypothetical protein IAT38_003470 [Cryptococcus sp. DSM 104549]